MAEATSPGFPPDNSTVSGVSEPPSRYTAAA
jgi:hypothetical protein